MTPFNYKDWRILAIALVQLAVIIYFLYENVPLFDEHVLGGYLRITLSSLLSHRLSSLRSLHFSSVGWPSSLSLNSTSTVEVSKVTDLIVLREDGPVSSPIVEVSPRTDLISLSEERPVPVPIVPASPGADLIVLPEDEMCPAPTFEVRPGTDLVLFSEDGVCPVPTGEVSPGTDLIPFSG
ncbi:hypothetical protein F4806DRAFT_506941 [Annulohypoxylon nitens]|nr:hypothetical protein F4806DRAFT_506941 [Annulohypoxylon nitens]